MKIPIPDLHEEECYIYAKNGKEKTSAFSEYYRDDLGYENLRTGEY